MVAAISAAVVATIPASEAGARDDAAGLQNAAPSLILASGSATRASLLAAAGLRFTVHVPKVDESAVKQSTRAQGGTAADAAQALALQKARSIAAPEAIVIGCDQILVCAGAWYDKPADMDAARRQLMALRGQEHTLITATVALRGGQRIWRDIAVPRLTMRAFSGAFLDAYLAAEGSALLTSVGAYRLEGLGMHLFSAIEGERSAILGLPLLGLMDFLRTQGVLRA